MSDGFLLVLQIVFTNLLIDFFWGGQLRQCVALAIPELVLLTGPAFNSDPQASAS